MVLGIRVFEFAFVLSHAVLLVLVLVHGLTPVLIHRKVIPDTRALQILF